MTKEKPRLRACALLAVAGALSVALAAPAAATVQESRTCRVSIANQGVALIRTGFRAADVCHQKKAFDCTPAVAGGSDREACLVVTSPAFDPVGNLANKRAEVTATIDGSCAPTDPVAANYAGGDIDGSLIDAIEDDVEGSSSAVQGVEDLECVDAKTACHLAISRGRTDVLRSVVRDIVRCQKKIDRTATSFGPVDPSCLGGTPNARILARANARIQAACAGVTGADVGSCDPLPGCVTGAATQTGLGLGQAIYSTVSTQVCGNGAIEGTEQCDDGGTTPGDGCNAACESEGGTCDGSYAGVGSGDGTRRIVVSISTPEPLGGVEIGLDYPQFQIGLPGVGSSSLVGSRFAPLQTAGLGGINDSGNDVKVVMVNLTTGFANGDLFRIDFDNCVGASQNLCNRNQNVFGCCFNPSSSSQFSRCSDGATPCATNADCTGIGAGVCGPTRCTDGTTVCTTDAACALGQLCEKSPVIRCVANPPSCGTTPSLSPPALGVCQTSGTPNGGCPGDNACVSQTSIVGCSVSNPSSLLGQPVSGVTCSVAMTELP